jgi:hypothetical protein
MAPQSELKWVDEFCSQKEVEHALDRICDYRIFLAAGISERAHVGRIHSYPAGYGHYRIRFRFIQGGKILEGFGPFSEKLRYWERRWAGRPR